jgi:hypothetical protein
MDETRARKLAMIEHMKHLMRKRRAEIDPKVLAMAKAAAERKQGLKPKSQTVPYDRAAATKAVELFLAGHPEQKKFRAKLLAFLTKSSH